jgi:hypothetical protein
VRRAAPTPHRATTGAKKKDRRVHVTITFGSNYRKSALADTGATICVMARSVFERLPPSIIRGHKNGAGNVKVTSASAHQLKVHGSSSIVCHVEGLGTVSWPFTIVEELTSGIIIGQDLLEEFQATVDCKSGTVSFKRAPMVSAIRAEDRVHVQPFSSRYIKGRVDGERAVDSLVVVDGIFEEIPTGVQTMKAGRKSIDVLRKRHGAGYITTRRYRTTLRLITPRSLPLRNLIQTNSA